MVASRKSNRCLFGGIIFKAGDTLAAIPRRRGTQTETQAHRTHTGTQGNIEIPTEEHRGTQTETQALRDT
ncbi:hypothetical protein E2C01_092599 [Portunus trituberculatus]|uniref:Uncharacterized protein n=1 Tax=Portunus trituberculatus TaxID=210409 RepID=A0A5B7JY67_PORTR|nr:hypothetical protein [Portunus trituberculatus]